MAKAMTETAAIRNLYSELGVENYYQRHGAEYRNPHLTYINALIKQNEHRLDYEKSLDFCCGSGEVTQCLQSLGYSNLLASDPYTQEAYERNIGSKCLSLSFKEVIQGRLDGQYTSIISSFAMHLCPKEQLYPLTHQLLLHAPILVIITPHKRPQLENISDICLLFEDFVLTERGKKVRLKAYTKS